MQNRGFLVRVGLGVAELQQGRDAEAARVPLVRACRRKKERKKEQKTKAMDTHDAQAVLNPWWW